MLINSLFQPHTALKQVYFITGSSNRFRQLPPTSQPAATILAQLQVPAAHRSIPSISPSPTLHCRVLSEVACADCDSAAPLRCDAATPRPIVAPQAAACNYDGAISSSIHPPTIIGVVGCYLSGADLNLYGAQRAEGPVSNADQPGLLYLTPAPCPQKTSNV